MLRMQNPTDKYKEFRFSEIEFFFVKKIFLLTYFFFEVHLDFVRVVPYTKYPSQPH